MFGDRRLYDRGHVSPFHLKVPEGSDTRVDESLRDKNVRVRRQIGVTVR